nr:hypothetical protein [Tanacetum cinerariifolium]
MDIAASWEGGCYAGGDDGLAIRDLCGDEGVGEGGVGSAASSSSAAASISSYTCFGTNIPLNNEVSMDFPDCEVFRALSFVLHS